MMFLSFASPQLRSKETIHAWGCQASATSHLRLMPRKLPPPKPAAQQSRREQQRGHDQHRSQQPWRHWCWTARWRRKAKVQLPSMHHPIQVAGVHKEENVEVPTMAAAALAETEERCVGREEGISCCEEVDTTTAHAGIIRRTLLA